MALNFGFLGSLFSKPFILSLIFSLGVSVFAGWLWMDRENKSILFEQQSDSIIRLTRELNEQKTKTQEAYDMLKALDEASSSTRGNITEKRNEKSDTLKGIENVVKTDTTGNYDVPLDPELARMLDKVCERIRGKACESP